LVTVDATPEVDGLDGSMPSRSALRSGVLKTGGDVREADDAEFGDDPG
jgi:hypothetical protein